MRLSVVLALVIMSAVGFFMGLYGAALVAFVCAVFYSWAFKEFEAQQVDVDNNAQQGTVAHKSES